MCVRNMDSVITLYSGQLISIDFMRLNRSKSRLTLAKEIYPFVTSHAIRSNCTDGGWPSVDGGLPDG